METYRFGKFEITLSAKFTDEYIDKSGHGEMGKYIVYVGYKGKRLQFSFYQSVYDTQNGKTELDKTDLVSAFQCFISDVLLVISNNWDRAEMEREIGELGDFTYIALKRSAASFLRLFEESDIYELSDSVNEYLDDNY